MYTFNMQTVLDHRQFIEDNLKKELAEIRERLTTAQRQLESLRRKEMETAAALKQEQATGISSDQVVAFHAYLKRLSGNITRQVDATREIEKQESVKQDALVQAMKKRQILEKLRDKDLDRYNRMMLKKEMNFIDEIAVNQFVRNTVEKSGEGQ